MKMKRGLKLLAVLAVLSLILAACGDDAGDDTTTTAAAGDSTTTAAPEATTTTSGEPAGQLTIGGLLPQTGSLAFLDPPEEAGVYLALSDINAAGGVLGQDVVFIPGDSGDTSTDIANATADSHLAAGVQALVGPASSGVAFTVIDKITGAGVIMFSPANTSALLTDYEDNGLYFRTAPSDFLQGQVLAEVVAEDSLSAGVIYRQDPYGEGLAERFREVYEGLGGEVTDFIAYPAEG
ncbi:MAG: ABC transporter substrate-binding protein, partial [Actinomycetota bacterium]|nr:ABC transporter substrate-binding protein [Actinomycetota bacterium]